MPEKNSTIGTNQGQKPDPEDEPTLETHENATSEGPHDTDHQVIININSEGNDPTDG